jgi:hypothetical protein
MEKNSTLVQNSRYVSGGQTEANSKALEWWERATFTLDESDTQYVVEKNTVGRLDLIAQAFLDDTHLWWLVAQYNAILDPFTEIFEGRILRIPSKARAQTMLSGKLGGYPSAREVPVLNITPIV